MKWIKGTWDKTNDIIFINPVYITTIDTGRKLLWAQDCITAVRYDEEDYPLLLKLMNRTEEEAADPQQNTTDKGEGNKKNEKVRKETSAN